MNYIFITILVTFVTDCKAVWRVQDSMRKILETIENADEHEIVFPRLVDKGENIRSRRNVDSNILQRNEMVPENNFMHEIHGITEMNAEEKSNSYSDLHFYNNLQELKCNKNNTEIYHDYYESNDAQNTEPFEDKLNKNMFSEEEVTVIKVKNWVIELNETPNLFVKDGLEAEWVSTGERTPVETHERCILQTGSVRGEENSLVALTTCNASPIDSTGTGDMTGLIQVDQDSYFIEPLVETGGLNREHPHLIYR